MTDTIAPALTRDEWRLLGLWKAGKLPGGRVRGKVVMSLPDEQVPCAIAVGNDYLPASSPHKITWADVEALRLFLAKASDYWDDGPSDAGWQSIALTEAIAKADALADKLSALLRPA